MDIRWSPRKRIKLNVGKHLNVQKDSPVKLPNHALPSIPSGSSVEGVRRSVKRVSTDFNKELDELLEQPETGFNPTQVFVVDPDMELAMLRMDTEHVPATAACTDFLKRELSRTLSRRDTGPLSEKTNLGFSQELKTHISEPFGQPAMFSQGTTQLVDDLEGIDIDQLTAAIDAAESVRTCKEPDGERVMFSSRCIVEEVPVRSWDGKGVGMKVREVESGKVRYVTLEGVWLRSIMEDPWQVAEGDVVHFLASEGKKWDNDHAVFGDSDSLFPDIVVFHPDIVISSTTLSASATCQRRSVIQNRVLAPQVGPPSEDKDDIARALSPIIGNCVHEAVQAAAAENNFTESFILSAGEKALQKDMLAVIWSVGAVPSAVVSQLRSRLTSISRWGSQHWPRIASKLRGCEVEIRPKSLGVTGKLDMDIEDADGARSCVEIKTGKPHAIHVGQVVLYYLLEYVEKFEKKNPILPANISQEFTLLYLPPGGAEAESIKVKITAREAQNIMRNRNLVASHTLRRTLPDPIMKKGDCRFCPSRTECAASYKGNDKKFFQSLEYSRRNNVKVDEVIRYQEKWLDWIDQQPTMEVIGGLSAVRRMRGNLLHMSALALMKDSKEPFFYNWMPVLTSSDNTNNIPNSELMRAEFNPKNRIGRAFAVDTEGNFPDRIFKYIISPALEREGNRILLCAPSHDKLDMVLEQCIAGMDKKITRIASKALDAMENVRSKYMLPEDWMWKVDEIEKSTSLFACTVKAVHHELLSRGNFNVAVVIDAHKVPDALLWGVLIRARQVLLIGRSSDDCQSPEDFLFKRLRPVACWKQDAVVVIEE